MGTYKEKLLSQSEINTLLVQTTGIYFIYNTIAFGRQMKRLIIFVGSVLFLQISIY